MSNGRFLIRSSPNLFAATTDAADRGGKTAKCRGGILWILRTGARWQDLPDRFPPYQTCHRRFQMWVRDGTLKSVLETLAEDLRTRGKLDLSECFIDGTFVSAKKGAAKWERPSGAKARNSWQWQTALVFLSPSTPILLRRMKSHLSEKLSPKFLPMSFPVT